MLWRNDALSTMHPPWLLASPSEGLGFCFPTASAADVDSIADRTQVEEICSGFVEGAPTTTMVPVDVAC